MYFHVLHTAVATWNVTETGENMVIFFMSWPKVAQAPLEFMARSDELIKVNQQIAGCKASRRWQRAFHLLEQTATTSLEAGGVNTYDPESKRRSSTSLLG